MIERMKLPGIVKLSESSRYVPFRTSNEGIYTDEKQSLATQSTQHMTLSAQLTAAQTQNTILQAEIERATLSISAMKAEVEVTRQKNKEADEMAAIKVKAAEDERDRRIGEIEEELRAAETIRRKLHNQVQELKGEFFSVGSLSCTDVQATLESLLVSDLLLVSWLHMSNGPS